MFLNSIGVVILVLNFVRSNTVNSLIEVKIKNGIVRGEKKFTLFDQREYSSFRGIPYAKPPLKERRFLPPEQPDNWNGILDTINFKPECTQIKAEHTEISGDEDCLYLNVYAPVTKSTEKLPVMFFTHGGGFFEGSSDGTLSGPDFLVEKDVILVTFNYRLAIFGFLSLGDDTYSGNMGLKDQLMALAWVNENIEYFNGDPNRITIFGHSAGAIMTHLLAISPVSQGLFQRAIMLSGTALFDWVTKDVNHREAVFQFAKKEQNIDDYESLLQFLQSIDSHKLFYGTKPDHAMNPGRRHPNLHWTPVIEPKNTKSSIITNHPEFMIKAQGSYNFEAMFGFTSHEILYALRVEATNPEYMQPFDEQFEIYLPNAKFQLDYNSDEYREMADEIREFYFGYNGSVDNDTFYEYIDLMSDVMFGYSIDQSVKNNIAHNTQATYYFRFSVDAKLNVLKQLKGMSEWNGTSHGDELCYAFKCSVYSDEMYKSFDEDSIERQTINHLTTLWTNYAKYGNPTPNNQPIKWKPATNERHNFLEIGDDGLVPAQNPNYKSIKFWNDLFEKYEHLAIAVGDKLQQQHWNKNDEL